MYWYLNGKHLDGASLETIRNGKKIIIWGKSRRDKMLCEEVDPTVIQCVFELDQSKWGTSDEGVPVCEPVAGEDAVIVSSIYNWRAVTAQAAEFGYHEVYFFVLDDRGEETEKYLEMFMPRREENRVPSDKTYKYIHVIPDQKFVAPVVELIEYGLNMDEHFFFVYDMFRTKANASYGAWELYGEMMHKYGNVYLLHNVRPMFLDNWDPENRENLDRLLEKAEKIIFHSAFRSEDNDIGYWQMKSELISKKGVFIPWSLDEESNRKCYRYIKDVICNVRMAVVNFMALWDIFCEIYPEFEDKICFTKGMSYARLTKRVVHNERTRNVLIAHSAVPYTNAVETMEQLKDIDGSVRIFCITSYGSDGEKYAERGKEIFGDRFIAVDQYMNYDQYVEFLSTIDVAVFGMDVVHGRDTIELLFWLGSKVYLKPDTEIWQRFKSMGYRIEDYYRAKDQSIEELFDNPNEEWNRAVAADEFDPDIKVRQWRELYEYDFENGTNNWDNYPVQ